MFQKKIVIRTEKGVQEGYGRDMGGMESISPILFPLCIKAFPKIMGEMRLKSVIT